jgi:rare lipoprotein A
MNSMDTSDEMTIFSRAAPLRRAIPVLAAAVLALALAACGSAPSRGPAGAEPAARDGAEPPQVSAPAARRGGGYYKDDGPDDTPPSDLDRIPDAQPRLEPIHRYANRPYNVFGRDYVPATERLPFRERGMASWYGRRFHGKPTASGEPYDMYAMTAAHPTLPIPSYVRVTNVANGRSVVLRVNDRGPFHPGRIIDLSYAAAHRLGYVNAGSVRVEVEAILPDEVDMVAAARPVPPLRGRTPAVVDAPTASAAPTGAPASPAAAAEPDPTVVGSAERGVFLQLGAFSSAANAEDFRGMVREELAMLADRLELRDEGGRFQLQLGPYATTDEARAEAERIAQVLKLRPFVVLR